MKQFIKSLATLCLALGIVSSNANAGLITEKLGLDYKTEYFGTSFNFYEPNGNPVITSKSTITKGHWADIYWTIDTSGLQAISFNIALFGDYGLASLFLDNETLWSEAGENRNSTKIILDVSDMNFLTSNSNMLSLRFRLEDNNFNRSYVRVASSDKSSLQLSNIQLTRTEVPEPSSIALFLLAMAFITRKQWAK